MLDDEDRRALSLVIVPVLRWATLVVAGVAGVLLIALCAGLAVSLFRFAGGI